jgi:hypothetical protein
VGTIPNRRRPNRYDHSLRSGRWKYIHYFELEGMDELYNLKTAPYELKNLIHQRGAGRVPDKLKKEMEGLLKATSANHQSGAAEKRK